MHDRRAESGGEQARASSGMIRLAILLFGLTCASATAGADDGWLHEFDEATAAARLQGKDLLIVFSGTDWCLPCKELWKQTLSQREFVDLASRCFVLLDIDDLAREKMPEGAKSGMSRSKNDTPSRRFPRSCWPRPRGFLTRRPACSRKPTNRWPIGSTWNRSTNVVNGLKRLWSRRAVWRG